MFEWVKLADFLDKQKKYVEADFISKIAFDLSFLEDHPSKSGLYGIYYADFPKELQQKLKNKLGPIPQNMGIKKFRDPQQFGGLYKPGFIQENLALIYFPKVINEYTDMKAPYVQPLSLSTIISNKIIITQKMPGIHLTYGTELDNKIENDTINAIIAKLEQVGIRWNDCHSGNFLVDQNKYNELLEANKKDYDKIILTKKNLNYNDHISQNLNCDLSTGASIIDFGEMQCKAGSIVAQEIQQFGEKIKQFYSKQPNRIIKSDWIKAILTAINYMNYYG